MNGDLSLLDVHQYGFGDVNSLTGSVFLLSDSDLCKLVKQIMEVSNMYI